MTSSEELFLIGKVRTAHLEAHETYNTTILLFFFFLA